MIKGDSKLWVTFLHMEASLGIDLKVNIVLDIEMIVAVMAQLPFSRL